MKWRRIQYVEWTMDVDEATAGHKAEYKGKTYYFCAPACKANFEENPEKYVK